MADAASCPKTTTSLTGITEMAEPTPYQKLAANLAHLRKRGASPERQKQEIEKFKLSQDAKTKAERALSGIEKVGATLSKGLSGATFGLHDEAMGLFDKGTKDEQRIAMKQLEEDNPALAFGAELAGAIATPGSFLKAAPRAAHWGVKAATMLGEGALQGAASAFGNAEGNVEERFDETRTGAGMGAGAAGVVGGLVKGGGRVAGRVADRFGMKAPKLERTMERIADQTPDEDIAAARQRMAVLGDRKLGHEMMVADVLPQGEGALRQAATSNKTVRKSVDAELKGRNNRLANLADDRLLEHTGASGESVDKTLAGMRKSAQDKSRPFYDAAQKEADAFPKKERLAPEQYEELAGLGGKVPDGDPIDAALALPFVRNNIRRVKAAEKFKALPDDDHQVLGELYKEIGEDIRLLQEKRLARNMTTTERRELGDLIAQRGKLAEGIEFRAPTHKTARGEYAGDASAGRAFERGAKSRDVPADMIPDEIATLDAPNQPFYKRGAAETFRSDVPASELGDLARFQSVLKNLSTKEDVSRFRALYGDDTLKSYLGQIMEMARLQGMKAGGGESTTVDKLMEQMQAEPDAAIAGMVGQLLRGNPMAAIANAAPQGMIGKTLDNLRRSKSAEQNADFLMQRGSDKVEAALDLVERLRREGKLPANRNWKKPNPGYAPSRMAGSLSSRN